MFEAKASNKLKLSYVQPKVPQSKSEVYEKTITKKLAQIQLIL